MALDEPKDSDEIFEIGGYRYLVDRALMRAVRAIAIDLTPLGFDITSVVRPSAPFNPGARGNSYDGCA